MTYYCERCDTMHTQAELAERGEGDPQGCRRCGGRLVQRAPRCGRCGELLHDRWAPCPQCGAKPRVSVRTTTLDNGELSAIERAKRNYGAGR